MLATGENSSNCQEESCNNPVADNYFSHESIYSLCQEEAAYMTNRDELGRFKKGFKHNEETKAKLKGRVPWNKDKTGIYSEETLQKIKTARKKQTFSEDTLKKFSEIHKGVIFSDQRREKISEALTGIKRSNETKLKISKARQGKCTAHENPSWNGGVSFLPYCHKFNEVLKEQIRERDNRTCQLCGRTEKENLQLFKHKLSMHHVHYDKPNCEPDLISLCNQCSSKVNFKREYYENRFIEKLKQRGLIK